MKMVLAPDSFKGSLTAEQACKAMEEGALRVFSAAEIVAVPMADGGEGTTEALVAATVGQMRTIVGTGPLPEGEKIAGKFGLLGDGKTAVVEMAQLSGLPLVPVEDRNPLYTTTYGTGEMIAVALAEQVTGLIVGVGGSATNDCGAGMAQALGVKFFDSDERELADPMTGRSIGRVARVDLSDLHPGVARCRIDVACDVDNPLLGPRGAAAVYAPQKGAGPADIRQLEENLVRFIDVVEARIGRRVRDEPGAGAAGGIAAGLMAFLGGRLRPGVDIVLGACGLAGKLVGADLVLTGEGRIDAQTANGKTVSGVARVARAAGVPVIALAGGVGEGIEALQPLGLRAIRTLAPASMPVTQAMARGRELLTDATERVVREFWASPS